MLLFCDEGVTCVEPELRDGDLPGDWDADCEADGGVPFTLDGLSDDDGVPGGGVDLPLLF